MPPHLQHLSPPPDAIQEKTMPPAIRNALFPAAVIAFISLAVAATCRAADDFTSPLDYTVETTVAREGFDGETCWVPRPGRGDSAGVSFGESGKVAAGGDDYAEVAADRVGRLLSTQHATVRRHGKDLDGPATGTGIQAEEQGREYRHDGVRFHAGVARRLRDAVGDGAHRLVQEQPRHAGPAAAHGLFGLRCKEPGLEAL